MQADSKRKHAIQWIGFFAGPLMALVALLTLPSEYDTRVSQPEAKVAQQQLESPDASQPAENLEDTKSEFSWSGRATLAVMVWMGIWWLSEAIHISETALLPLILFPLLGATDIKEAAFPYANHLIFLYLGGFIIALSMEKWGLGKRIALLTLKLIGTSAPNMIAGFMIVTAILSAFVSNTATTAMMLPIAISTVALLRSQLEDSPDNETKINQFGTCLLLAIAYSASVGGIMTIIGTPTNAFLIGYLRDTISSEYQMDFSFAGWLPIGGALVVAFLPIMYVVLTYFLFPIRGIELRGGAQMINNELRKLGTVKQGEWNTLFVFCLAIVLWLARPLLTAIEFSWGDSQLKPLGGLTDTGIAMCAAMLLYTIPANLRKREFTMDWETTNRMPWGILILFGGGLSLAAAIKANGVAEFLGSFASRFGSLPTVLVILLVTAAIVFLTELTSNVATTTSLVPVLAALAPGVGIHPYLLIIPATVAASCAFMLPVATPPNAIVFGSGEITLPQMLRAGIVLNILSIFIVTLLAILVVGPWLGV